MWYALRTAPQRENKAKALLTERGFEAAVPTERRFLRRSRGRKIERTYPMVVGYVLVRACERDMPWNRIFDSASKPYIKSVVGCAGQPALIADEPVARLVGMSSSAIPYQSSVNTRRASFQPGDPVQISDGPFRGHEAKIEDISECKAQIVVTLLGKSHTIGVDLGALTAA